MGDRLDIAIETHDQQHSLEIPEPMEPAPIEPLINEAMQANEMDGYHKLVCLANTVSSPPHLTCKRTIMLENL